MQDCNELWETKIPRLLVVDNLYNHSHQRHTDALHKQDAGLGCRIGRCRRGESFPLVAGTITVGCILRGLSDNKFW